MEDLYGNLENYNEVHALEELRSENLELKAKLKEYTSSMDKLQKDFDKTASEFKRLECNYSSLLKTARAEIQRKTQIITNINVEKDMLICKALQNGDTSVLNYKNEIAAKKDKDESGIDNVKTKREVSKPSKPDSESENERIDERRAVSSEGRLRSSSSDMNKTQNIAKSSHDSHSSNKSETKEFIPHKHVPDNNSMPRDFTMNNRRSHVPEISGQDARFSPNKEYNTTNSNEDNVYRNIDSQYNNYYSNKLSEPWSMDGKTPTPSYHDSSREYINQRGRHDNNRYRSGDQYEYTQRYRRDSSPVRSNRRQARDYYKDGNQRFESSRNIILESPPQDNYMYTRRQTSYQSNYSDFQHNEPNRSKYEDRYSFTNKSPFYQNEPPSKRNKRDSYNSCDDNNEYKNKVLEADSSKRMESQYSTCQSPDHEYQDISGPIKEIRNIALTKLEDPRLPSNKYTLKAHGDKTFLSAVPDKTCSLRKIDKTHWGIQKVSVPFALLQQPSDRQSKRICMPVDSPVTNKFSNCREISHKIDDCVRGDPSKPPMNNEQTNSYPVNNYKKLVSCNTTKNNIQSEDSELKLIYDLQKSKLLCDKDSLEEENDFSNIIDDNTKEYCNNYKSNKEETKVGENSLSIKFSILSENRNYNKNCYPDTNWSGDTPVDDNNIYLSMNKVVECDLELSDETSDNTDMQKKNDNDISRVEHLQDPSSVNDNVLNKQQESGVLNERASEKHVKSNRNQSKHDNIVKSQHIKKITKEKIIKDNSVGSKKKSHKSKDESCIISAEKAKECNDSDKKSKRKIEKDKQKEVKTQTHNLFSESSGNSLITPDDLGINTVQTKQQSASHLKSIFKGTQDAVEVKEKPSAVNSTECVKAISVLTNDDICASLSDNNLESLRDNKISDNKMVHDDDITSKLKMMYENLVPLTKDSDDVNTVIISTGCQPVTSLEKNIEQYGELTTQNDEGTIQVDNVFTRLNPHMETHPVYRPLEPNTNVSYSSCNSIETQLGNCVTISNTIMSQDVTDIPDVRIFVRRKRKLLKKAPVT